MTKKHFEALAAAVRESREAGMPNKSVRIMAEQLADVCCRENPRFDVTRFYVACGVTK